MKYLLTSIIVMVVSCAGAFGQQYLTSDQDVGVDFVIIKSTKANLREKPADDSPILTTLEKDSRLILLSRSSYLREWYEVADIFSLKKGWVRATTLDIFYSGMKDIIEAELCKSNSIPLPKSLDEVSDQGSGGGQGGVGSGRGSGGGQGTGVGKGQNTQLKTLSKPKPKYTEKPRQNGQNTQLEILSKPRHKYTEMARQNNVQGTVSLQVTFLSTGKIGQITVVKGLSDGLTQSAIDAARGIRFIPPLKNGQPYTVTKIVEWKFTIY